MTRPIGRPRLLCDCGEPATQYESRPKGACIDIDTGRRVRVCTRCAFLDGSCKLDGAVIELLRLEPELTTAELAERLGRTHRVMQRVVKSLLTKKRLSRHWRELDTVVVGTPGTTSYAWGGSAGWVYYLVG